MPYGYTRIAEFHDVNAAHLCRSVLEGSGIPAILEGEHSASWMPAPLALMTTKLLVPEGSEGEAIEILEGLELDENELTEEEVEAVFVEGADSGEIEDEGGGSGFVCPQCGSEETETRGRSWFDVERILDALIGGGQDGARRRCFRCGFQWRGE